MIVGQKHLIKCRCILTQFKKSDKPPSHQFPVFSVIGEDGQVIPKYAQCNSCGIIHKVIDICRSEIVETKEYLSSLVSIDDIRVGIHPNLCAILDKNSADISTWEACQHVIENKEWGKIVVLTSDQDGDTKVGKYVRILGESLYKVESFTRIEVV